MLSTINRLPLDACEIFLIVVLTTYLVAAIICFVGAYLIPEPSHKEHANEPTSDRIVDE
jgi:hypothetical protein